MQSFRNIEDVYDRCISEGNIEQKEKVEIEKIKATLKIAEEDIESAKDNVMKKRWNSAYKMHYDVLHELVEAYLLFDKVKTQNHLCLFAYLCVKHAELELDWNFFEKIRTKRNGINYYYSPVSEKDFKDIELQANLYIKLLMGEVKNKIKSYRG